MFKDVFNKKWIYQTFLIIIGSFLVAFSINVFFVPNNISSGGATGVGIILKYVLNFPISATIIIFNLPLFVLAVNKIGWKFSIRTIVGILFLTVFVEITKNFSKYEFFKNGTDMIISSVFGGLIMGTGLSLVFKGNSSTGGSELLAQIVYKYRPALNISTLMLIIDSFIILATAITFESINSGLYSLIAIFVSKKTIDIVFEGINYTKVINIITKKENEICNRILTEVSRGATALRCVGKYTGDEFSKIECVATMPQISKIKDIVKEEDKEAFIYIAAANEVLGYGFKMR